MIDSIGSLYQGKVIYLVFKEQVEMNRAMIRFSEYQENPHWRNKVFTLGQIRQWYTVNSKSFCYYTDWSGYNIYPKAIKPFLDGLFDPLTSGEMLVLEIVKGHQRQSCPCVIAVSRDDKDLDETFDHELCHTIFYINPEYRDLVTKELESYEKHLYEFKDQLTEWFYNETTHLDEINAYVATTKDRKWMEENGLNVPVKLEKRLKSLFNKYKQDAYD